jgi:hypothetical protein
MFRERTRLACWFRRRAEIIFPSIASEVRERRIHRKVRDREDALASTRDACAPYYFANSYRYSTNDIVAPSKSWIFGFVDSMM